MRAILRGVKRIEYVKKDTGEQKKGIELHLERPVYPTEGFKPGSVCVFTEYVRIVDDSTQRFADRILDIDLGDELDLVYVQQGRYSNLVDVNVYAG